MTQAVDGPLVLCDGGETPVADIVFVHGLRGNSLGTWTSGDVCWPKDLLGPHLENVRIITWGYDSSVANPSDYSSQNSIFSHAENLLSDLGSRRIKEPNRPLIFIGHSLGGLVIKEALIRSSVYFHNRQDLELGAIYRSTIGIIFLATPHRGSDKTNLAQIVEGVAKLALWRPNKKLLRNLERESDVLERQRRAFASISEQISLRCLFEEKPTTIGIIVPESSACIDGFHVKTNSIPANHMDICKFGSENDLGYQRIFFHVHSLLRETKKQSSLSSQADESKFLTSSSIPSAAQSASSQPEESDGKTDLHYAAACGDRAKVGRLLQLDETNINATDFNGMTALHHAVTNGRDNLIIPLLRGGAKTEVLDDQGMTPLMHAAKSGSTQSIRQLLRGNANPLMEDNDGHIPAYHAFRSCDEPALLLLDVMEKDCTFAGRLGSGALDFALTSHQATVVVYLLGDELFPCDRHRAKNLWDVETAKGLLLFAEFPIDTQPCSRDLMRGNVLQRAVMEQESYTISLAQMMPEIGMNLNSRFQNGDGSWGPTILHCAAIMGNLDVVRFLINESVDFEVRWGPKEETALHIAIGHGHEGLVNLLLDAGANIEAINRNGGTPLHMAVEHGHEGPVKVLLDAGAYIEAKDSDENTPLHITLQKQNKEVLKRLLDAGADVGAKGSDKNIPLHIAVQSWDKSAVEILLNAGADIAAKDSHGNTPLHIAAWNWSQDKGILKVLLDARADIEARNSIKETALHIAVYSHSQGVIMLLLNAGADIEAKDIKDQTPLHIAFNEKNIATIKRLLRRQHDEKRQSVLKNELLHSAVSNGDIDMTKSLLKIGADVNSKTASGNRALHIAARYNNNEMIDLLLKCGANASAVDGKNRTAMHLAASLGHRDIKSVLEAASLRKGPQPAKNISFLVESSSKTARTPK